MSLYGKKGNIPSKFQVEILMTKMKEYFNLQKERKSNQVVKDEKLLLKLLGSQSRSKLQEQLAMEKIVNTLRYINALKLLGSYAEALKQNSVTISEPLKHQDRLFELLPYTMGIIYASKPTGLTCISQFRIMMEQIFGKQGLELSYNKGELIPIELRKCFEPTQPSFKHINQYALEMCQRNEYSLQVLNSVGHNFSENTIITATYIPPPILPGTGGYANGKQFPGNQGQGNNGGGQGNYHNQPKDINIKNSYDYNCQNYHHGNNKGNNYQQMNQYPGYNQNNNIPKQNVPNGYGGSYVPSYTPDPEQQYYFNPTDSYIDYNNSNNKQQPQSQSQFRYPATSSTIIGPNNSSTFH